MRRNRNIHYIVLLLTGLFMLLLCGMEQVEETVDVASVKITEVCSHNDTIVYDDRGRYFDFIELYNDGETPIELNGWRLTDSPDEKGIGFFFEDEILEVGEYQVAFVAKETCNFALSEGDNIYLYDNEGKNVDTITIPIIEDEKSFVWLEDENEWVNNYYPSPGEENERVIIEEALPMLKEEYIPQFSVESGFYNSDFYLEMTTREGCEIYYTLDGSEPSKDSILYTGPILITDVTNQPNKWCTRTDFSVKEYVVPDFLVDKCTIIRAVAVSKEDQYSEEKTASYYVGYEGRYGYNNGYTVSIITDPDNLFSHENGMYVIGAVGEMNEETLGKGSTAVVNYNRDGEGWRRPAIVHVFNEEKECIYQQEIMLGVHGGFSTTATQKSFNLIAREEEKIFPGLFSDKHSSLILRAGGVNDVASTKFRDVLNQSLVADRNFATQEAIPCQVFLDGEYWGFYNLRERLDLSMITAKYDIPEEHIIFVKNSIVLGRDDEEISHYKNVVKYAVSNDMSVMGNYRQIEEWIDIQSYIEYCCMEIFCANSDAFLNNYALWRTDTVTTKPYWDGKWRWVVFDTDDSANMQEDRTAPQVDSFVEGHWHVDPMDEPLFSSLIQNEEFRIRFAETFYEMCEMEYNLDRVYEYIDELESTYTEGCVLSHRRYYDPLYSEEDYHDEVSEVSFFYASRAHFIIPYMEEHILGYSTEE